MVPPGSRKHPLTNEFIQPGHKDWEKFFGSKHKKSDSKDEPAGPSGVSTRGSSSRASTKESKSTKTPVTSSKQSKSSKGKEPVVVAEDPSTEPIAAANDPIEPEEPPREREEQRESISTEGSFVEASSKRASVYQPAWGSTWQPQSDTLSSSGPTEIASAFDLSRLDEALNPFIKSTKIVRSEQGDPEASDNLDEVLSEAEIKYEAVDMSNNDGTQGQGQQGSAPPGGNNGGNGQDIDWRQVMATQLSLSNTLLQKVNTMEQRSNERPLKPEQVQKFKPESLRDSLTTQLFIEAIQNSVRNYGEDRTRATLFSCMNNEVAQGWYSSLSDEDQNEMGGSTLTWIRVLKRDFMPTSSELRLEADREVFSWSQGRTPLEYVGTKVRKLRMGYSEERDIVWRVHDGFSREPELKTAMASHAHGSLADYRGYLMQIQGDMRKAHENRTGKKVFKSTNVVGSSSKTSNSNAPNSSSSSTSSKPSSKSDEPPSPCRKCTALGLSKKQANHWSWKCPNKETPWPDKKPVVVGEKKTTEKKVWVKKPKVEGVYSGAMEDLEDVEVYEADEYDRLLYANEISEIAFAQAFWGTSKPNEDGEHASEDESCNYVSSLIGDNPIETTVPTRERDAKPKKGKTSPKQKFKKVSVCRTCPEGKNVFESASALHRHLKESGHAKAVRSPRSEDIIDLTNMSEEESEDADGISTYSETLVNTYWAKDGQATSSVADSGFGSSGVNPEHLHACDNVHIENVNKRVRGIGGFELCKERAHFDKWVKTTKGAWIKTRVKAYVMPNLPKALLLGNDWLVPLKISVANYREKLIFNSLTDEDGSPVEVDTKVRRRREFKRVPVRSSEKVIVQAGHSTPVPLRAIPVSMGQDYRFSSTDSTFPNAIISADQSYIMATNHSDRPMTISKGRVLGTASSIGGDDSFSHWAEATEEVNCFFGISKTAKKIAVGATVGLAALSTLGPNASKDNAETSKSVLKVDAADTVKVEGKAASTGVVQGPTMMVPTEKVGKETTGVIGKVSKWFKAAPAKVLSPLHKAKFNDVPDPIGDMLPELGLAKPEVEAEPLTIIAAGPHKDFCTVDVLGAPYVGFIGTDSTTENEPGIKSDLGWLDDPFIPIYKYPLPKGIIVEEGASSYEQVDVNQSLGEDPKYGSRAALLQKLIKRHKGLFSDVPGIVREPAEDWLRIQVDPALEASMKTKGPYRNSPRDRGVINNVFNENRRLGRMEKVGKSGSPYALQVFVAHQAKGDGQIKHRPVIDMRPLNAMVPLDAYPIPRQEDIIQALAGAQFISTFDVTSSFYQRMIHPDHRYRTAVVSHSERGHEQFAVAPMGFKNSVGHNQKFYDQLFKGISWRIVCCYVDDVVVFSKSFEQHLYDLEEVMSLMQNAGITLRASKAHVGYQSVELLGYKVNRLGLSNTRQRIRAIKALKPPGTLKQLEGFIGLASWNRHLVPFYAKRMRPLQSLKTKLLNQDEAKEAQRAGKRTGYVHRTRLKLSRKELRAFNDIKRALTDGQVLHHFNYNKRVYVFIDASKELGYGVAVYQSIDEDDVPLKKTSLRPILFLSRPLSQTEKGYWPTDMELSCLVWAVHKLKMYIEQTDTTVFTDHQPNPSIYKATSLTSSSPARQNLRHQGWAIQLSQYWDRLKIVYKEGKQMACPDALSRLKREVSRMEAEGFEADYSNYGLNEGTGGFEETKPEDQDEVDEVKEEESSESEPENEAEEPFEDSKKKVNDKEGESTSLLEEGEAWFITLIETPEQFRTDIRRGVEEDVRLRRIRDRLTEDGTLANGRLTHRNSAYAVYQDDLWYTDPRDGRLRLVIPPRLRPELLAIAHGNNHRGVGRTYDELIHSFFWPGMSKDVRSYIKNCPECQRNRTHRHPQHGNLAPLPTPPEPFHTVSIDLITDLPEDERFPGGYAYDAVMTVTDRLTKQQCFIPGRKDWGAIDWATAFWYECVCNGWGIPRVIITDRDRRFLNVFWSEIFKRAGVRMIATAAYHPSADGQSERSNQSLEIMLRYFVDAQQKGWGSALKEVESNVNCMRSYATNEAPFLVSTGRVPRMGLGVLAGDYGQPAAEDFAEVRRIVQSDVQDALNMAAKTMQHYHDLNHQAPDFSSGWAMLKLEPTGYHLQSVVKHKLGPQQVGPFRILETVGKRNAFRLDLPDNITIHPVISQIHLEPSQPPQTDPYGRDPLPPPPIRGADDEDEWEIESILRKRMRNRRPEYLIRWRGYGPEEDWWFDGEALRENADEMVEEYEATLRVNAARNLNRARPTAPRPGRRPGRPRNEPAPEHDRVETAPRRRGRPRNVPDEPREAPEVRLEPAPPPLRPGLRTRWRPATGPAPQPPPTAPVGRWRPTSPGTGGLTNAGIEEEENNPPPRRRGRPRLIQG